MAKFSANKKLFFKHYYYYYAMVWSWEQLHISSMAKERLEYADLWKFYIVCAIFSKKDDIIKVVINCFCLDREKKRRKENLLGNWEIYFHSFWTFAIIHREKLTMFNSLLSYLLLLVSKFHFYCRLITIMSFSYGTKVFCRKIKFFETVIAFFCSPFA